VLTTLGALAPIAQDAARLSGFGALSSGLQANYNNEYYSNLSLAVIVRGIESRRSQLRDKLQAKHGQAYDSFDIAAAVGEAVRYDASCSLINGLEQADEALQRLDNPSMDAVNRVLYKSKLSRALASTDDKAAKEFLAFSDTLRIDPTEALARVASGGSAAAGGAGRSGVSVRGASMAALTAQTYADMLNSLKTLRDDATDAAKSVPATVTFTVSFQPGSPSSTQTMAVSLSWVVGQLDEVIKEQRNKLKDDKTTGTFALCSTEAEKVVTELAKADANWITRDLNPGKLAELENAKYGAERNAQLLRDKLDRYKRQVAEFAESSFKAWQAGLAKATEAKPTLGSTWDAVGKRIHDFDLAKEVGAARHCAK
jgi:hypothetical protein